jgi:hypothetical protein
MATSGLLGVTGEHFVAGELSRRGLLVTLTRGNAPGVDILVFSPRSGVAAALQVKTSQEGKQPRGKWIMNEKDEDAEATRSAAFIFVYIPQLPAPPEFSLAPSRVVADTIHAHHARWLETPGRNGRAHSHKNDMRHFLDVDGKWRDRWDVLEMILEDRFSDLTRDRPRKSRRIGDGIGTGPAVLAMTPADVRVLTHPPREAT